MYISMEVNDNLRLECKHRTGQHLSDIMMDEGSWVILETISTHTFTATVAEYPCGDRPIHTQDELRPSVA